METSEHEFRCAVEGTHNCKAELAFIEPVSLKRGSDLVWEGLVHVFVVEGSAHATTAYAWSALIDGTSERGFYTVLGKPPINSAADAVRAGIVAENRSQR